MLKMVFNLMGQDEIHYREGAGGDGGPGTEPGGQISRVRPDQDRPLRRRPSGTRRPGSKVRVCGVPARAVSVGWLGTPCS